jgi:hypothetical protein
MVRFIAQSWLGEKLSSMGVVASWVETALKLPEDSLEAQIICFRNYSLMQGLWAS